MRVKPKKHLGQHFLIDKNICRKIADQYSRNDGCNRILEIGPGTGALTTFLVERELDVWAMEIDRDSIAYLKHEGILPAEKILEEDFLKCDLQTKMGKEPYGVVGNFPYNISSQILFKCLEHRHQIPEIMGMFQKEVALRLAEPPGSKQYGILSVLLQAYYDIEYCFTVDEHVFDPPPKVKSGVIRCTRNNRVSLSCDEQLFKQIVKTTFNQRRKTIRNGLKSILQGKPFEHPFLTLRPETLSVDQFVELTQAVEVALKD